MELKLLLILLRRWAWLLILGVLLGGSAAYLISSYQDPIYQATTQVMVIQPTESRVTADINLSDQELAQTYVSLLTTRPVLDAASERLGYAVSVNQVSARQNSGTRILEVTVRTGDPVRAAETANTLVDVLIEQNSTLQSTRFASSEQSLQAQITQVEQQIATLQDAIAGGTSQDTETRQEALSQEIATLRAEVITLQQEIDDLTSTALTPEEQEELLQKRIDLAQLRFDLSSAQASYNARLIQNPLLNDPEAEARISSLQEQILRLEQEIADLQSGTVAMVPGSREELAAKRAELAQKQFDLELAEDRYMDLVGGQSGSSADSRQETSLSLYQQLYTNLLSTYESVRLARLQNTPDLVLVEGAAVPGNPIEPQPLQDALLGAAVGLIIMGGIAFVIEYLDDTVKTPTDIAQLFNLPVIGLIADTGLAEDTLEVTVAKEPRSPVAEAYRSLRTNLEFAGVEQPLRTILVTSPSAADGKTTVTTNLATIIAQGGGSVTLIDADLRRPRIHRFLGLSNNRGLTDLFLTKATLGEASQSWGQSSGIKAITSGGLPPNPTELLGTKRMEEILAQAREESDVVIIDSPPMIVSDAALLASKVDGVVLVVRPGKTSVDAIEVVLEQFRRANARVVGVILNRIPRKGGFYGGYGYYYARYHDYSGRYYLNGDQPAGGSSSPNGQPGRLQRAMAWLRGG